jgi:hypothetical protein
VIRKIATGSKPRSSRYDQAALCRIPASKQDSSTSCAAAAQPCSAGSIAVCSSCCKCKGAHEGLSCRWRCWRSVCCSTSQEAHRSSRCRVTHLHLLLTASQPYHAQRFVVEACMIRVRFDHVTRSASAADKVQHTMHGAAQRTVNSLHLRSRVMFYACQTFSLLIPCSARSLQRSLSLRGDLTSASPTAAFHTLLVMSLRWVQAACTAG